LERPRSACLVKHHHNEITDRYRKRSSKGAKHINSPSRTSSASPVHFHDAQSSGVSTIENLHKAGAKLLAIEAGMTILLDQPEVVKLADRHGLCIVALD
jgi:hypothetical protein